MYKKIKDGILWTFFGNLVKGGSGILLISILSRELGPEKIGLIGILSVIYGLCETLLDFGVSQSIVSKKSVEKNELSSLFWLNQGLGLILFVAIYFLADPIADFIGYVEISKMIKILSIVFIIEPIDLVFQAILQKNMNFKVLESVSVIKQFSVLISTLLFLNFNLGIASYVCGIVAGAFVDACLLFRYFLKNKLWMPNFHFRLSECKKHLRFGFYTTLKSFLNFAGTNLDQIIVAKVFSIEVLGLYYFSKKIIEQPISFITSSFSKISFPLYSRMKKDHDIKNVYELLTKKISLIGFPILSIAFVFSPYLVELFFGNKWLESVELIRLFLIVGAIQIISVGFSSSVILSKDKPKELFLTDLFFTPTRLFLIFLSSLYSIKATIIFYMLIMLIKSIYLQSKTNKLINLSFKEYFSQLKNPIIISVVYIFLAEISNNFYASLIITTAIFYVILNELLKKDMEKILNKIEV